MEGCDLYAALCADGAVEYGAQRGRKQGEEQGGMVDPYLLVIDSVQIF
jgi:hypothetical protein